MQALGVRRNILQRGHIDGFRLARLSSAQLQGFPFTSVEHWRLHLLRLAHAVFKVFTRGRTQSGSCPLAIICAMLVDKHGCVHNTAVVESFGCL
jgi:hypothetical protein